MANKDTLRILRELRDIEESPEVQFHLWYNEEDVTTMTAMITGTPDTPYAYGLFSFRFQFPASGYPANPPQVTALTTNKNRTRFNPNIYAGGKVCLSILGTWRGQNAGEEWNPAHGILSILVSIQSLMGENPFVNEPGFERVKPEHVQLSEHYKRKIAHETIRISVIERIEDYFNSKYADKTFADTSKHLFMMYYRHYLRTVEREEPLVPAGSAFQKMPFEGGGNNMDGQFNYADLKARLNALFKRVQGETDEWIAQSKAPGSEWTSVDNLLYHNLLGQFKQIVASKQFDGTLELELAEPENPYVWLVTLFGRPGTNYEGGVFRVRMVFHKDFPSLRPRVSFITPFYHPNVSPDGFPWYRVKRMDEISQHLAAIAALFTETPTSDPATTLDLEASTLFFGTKEQKREFGRNARRCATRSVEYE